MEYITGSAGTIKTLFNGLAKYGVKLKTIEDLTGVKPETMVNSDIRIPIKHILRLAQKAGELTGVPSIGLKLGSDPSMVYPSGIGWGIMANSPTILEGITQFARFTHIITEFLSIELHQGDYQTSIIFKVDPRTFYTPFSMEVIFSRFLTTIQQILGKPVKPDSARFEHPKPDYVEEYYQLFGENVFFEQPESALVFPTPLLNQKISYRNEYLESFLTQHAETLMEQLASQKSFGIQVRQVIVNQLYTGQVDVEMVSQSLQISRSTLFRKLREENLTFKEILKETRRELAKDYLKDNNFSIAEIAFLLGFSDPSAFNRAFKKWERTSPIQFRKKEIL